MSLIVTLSASPSHPSRSAALAALVGEQLRAGGFDVEALNVRDLPAESLLHGRFDDPAVAAALELVDRAEGVVLVTPVYKAAYTGVLKSFLDLLPQFGLAGKVALPLATGGTLAHVLSIDYALRPVLAALNAQHVVSGLFLLDKLLERRTDGSLAIDPQLQSRLLAVIDEFATAVRRSRAAVGPSLLSRQQDSSIAADGPAAPAALADREAAMARGHRDGTSAAS